LAQVQASVLLAPRLRPQRNVVLLMKCLYGATCFLLLVLADAAVTLKTDDTKIAVDVTTRLTGNGQKISPMNLHGVMGMMIHDAKMASIPEDSLIPFKPVDHTVWIGFLSYACFGLFFGYLYFQARFKYGKTFSPMPEPGVLPRPGGFSFDLCSCLSDPKLCVIGFCCPCMRWADTLDQHGVLSYWPAFIAMFGLNLLYPYTKVLSFIAVVVLGAFCRQKLRNRFEITNWTWRTVFSDVMIWLCCQPCAIIQEAREEAVFRGRAWQQKNSLSAREREESGVPEMLP